MLKSPQQPELLSPIIIGPQASRDEHRYIAMDRKCRFFPPSAREKVEALYRFVAYDFAAPTATWSNRTHDALWTYRAKTPSLNLVTFDQKTGNPMAYFMANYVCGPDGMTLGEVSTGIHPDYLHQEIETDLMLLGHDFARKACKKDWGLNLVHCLARANTALPCQEESLKALGYYSTSKQFILCAQDLLASAYTKPPAGVTLHIMNDEDLHDVVAFMASQETLRSGDQAWTRENATAAVTFMYQHNYALLNIARKEGSIVGLVCGDIIPRAAGISLVGLECCLSKALPEREQKKLARAMLDRMALTGHTLSVERYRLPLHRVEITEETLPFYEKLGIEKFQEDPTLVVLRGSNDTINQNIRRFTKRLTRGIGCDSVWA